MKIGTFLTKFEAGELSRDEWTHEAHVRAAWLCLHTSPTPGKAMKRVKRGIVALNRAFLAQSQVGCGATPEMVAAAQRFAEKPPPAYHATLTRAFVKIIAGRMEPRESYERFRDRNLDLFTDKLGPVLLHYTPDTLFSDAARKKYVKPDLAPLPKAAGVLV